MRSKITKAISAILSLLIIAFSAQIPLTVFAEGLISDESVFQETTSENGFAESNMQNEDNKTVEESTENKKSINDEPATLSEDERPQVISRSDVEKNGHVGRLKELENNLGTMTFQNKDGTCTTYFFSEPVKYADESGVIHDKESVITSHIDKMAYAGDYAYANSNNDVRVYFPKALGGDTGIILNKEDINIELTPVFSKKTGYETRLLEAKEHMSEVSAVSAAPVKRQISEDVSSGSYNKDVIDYNAVFGNNTAIRYAPTLNGFKEDIVINSYDGTSEFVFRLKTNGLRLISEEGQYYLAEPDTLKRVVDIGALIVYSNDGKDVSVGYDHRYEIETVTDNQEYLIRAIVDKEFLSDEETVYPVIVDPSFEVKSENNNIMDMSVRIDGSVVPNSRNNAVGNHNVDRVDMRTFIKIPGLLNDSFFGSLLPYTFADPSEPSIKSIKLMMYSRGTSMVDGEVRLYKCNTSTALDWTYDSTYFTPAQYDAKDSLWAHPKVPDYSEEWIEFDITAASSSRCTRGVVLVNQFEGSSNYPAYQSFASTKDQTNKPKIVVNWTYGNNITFDAAIKATLNIQHNVTISEANEKHYFHFTPTETGFYTFESSENGNSDPKVWLYNKNKENLAQNDDSNNSDNRNYKLTYFLQSNKKYYIESGCYGSGTGSYLLNVSKTSDLSSLSTTDLTTSTTVNIDLPVEYQYQYLKFTPPASCTYSVVSSDNSGDPLAWLYDSSGEELAYDDDGGEISNFILSYSFTAGKTYYIVAGTFNTGDTNYKVSVSIATPEPPENLSVSNITGNSVYLSWTAPNNNRTDRWLIQYRINGGLWVNAATANTKSHTLEGLTASSTYEFRVYGEAGPTAWSGNRSAPSNTVGATTLPAQPTAVTVKSYTDNRVFLEWTTASPHGADRWLIQCRENGGEWYNRNYTTYKGYAASDLDASTTYEFRVYGERGETAWTGIRSLMSNTVSVTTLPAQPTAVTVTEYTDNRVFLEWNTATPHGAERWLIQCRENGGEWYNRNYTTYKGYAASDLDASTTYEFRVYGERGGTAWTGTRSPVSNTVSVTTLPAQPTNLTLNSCTDSRIYFTWDTATPHGADRWLVQYRVNGGSWYDLGTSTYKGYVANYLQPDTTYDFRVYGERGETAWAGTRSPVSNTLSVTTSTISNPTDQQIINNIQNSSIISSSKKDACKAAAQEMLNLGFEVSYIAGLLSNLCHEGNTGIFEYYNINTDYHPNLDSYLQANYECTYTDEYSGQYIYNKNLTTVYNLFTNLNNMGWKYNGARIGTGLGCIQWTFERTYSLIKLYREVNGYSSSLSLDQARIAESLMISRELSGSYIDIYNNWKSENVSSIYSENAAYQAAYDICVNYEKPTDKYNKGIQRGNFAKLIYSDITQ